MAREVETTGLTLTRTLLPVASADQLSVLEMAMLTSSTDSLEKSGCTDVLYRVDPPGSRLSVSNQGIAFIMWLTPQQTVHKKYTKPFTRTNIAGGFS